MGLYRANIADIDVTVFSFSKNMAIEKIWRKLKRALISGELDPMYEDVIFQCADKRYPIQKLVNGFGGDYVDMRKK